MKINEDSFRDLWITLNAKKVQITRFPEEEE